MCFGAGAIGFVYVFILHSEQYNPNTKVTQINYSVAGPPAPIFYMYAFRRALKNGVEKKFKPKVKQILILGFYVKDRLKLCHLHIELITGY